MRIEASRAFASVSTSSILPESARVAEDYPACLQRDTGV
jgi:hypothetical protein